MPSFPFLIKGLRSLMGSKGRPGSGAFPAAWLGMALLMGALAACGQPEPLRNELFFIRPDQHQIENPSATAASATGSACAFDKKGAISSAQRTAEYNLRSLTGQSIYALEFHLQDIYERNGQVCVDVLAQATPTRRSRIP